MTELSVKRPSAVIVFMIVLLALGGWGYSNLGADLMPQFNVPFFTISVTYPGASAEEIRKDVVKPIEDAISGLRGIEKIQSSALESAGNIMVQFTLETDVNSAFMDIQKKVENVSATLPKDANKPVIYKLDTGDMAVLTLSVSGSRSFEELYNEADKIKQKLEKINGVGNITLQGGNKKELLINLEKSSLDFYGISINTVIAKLKTQNLNLPAGVIKDNNSTENVKVVGEFKDIEDVKNIRIPIKNGGSIRLVEIANIDIAYPEEKMKMRLNNNSTIGISIQKQSDANVVEIVTKIKKQLDIIKKETLPGVKVVIATDTTTFITSSLSEIQRNVIEGIITTAIVLFLFLRSMRASIIVLIAIPTSLISTFFMMYVFDFTLNMMSLMALSLCIGILVDDSIVVLENIQRHLAKGKNKIDAAIEGRKEIGLAAIAITLCDVVVFMPIAFMSGMIGQFFKQFGLTVVFATLFSLLVSFTITPMLASKFLKNTGKYHDEDEEETDSQKNKSPFGKFMDKMVHLYKRFLIWSLSNRIKIIAIFLLILIGCASLLPLGYIKTQYMPNTDQSEFTVTMNLSPGVTLSKTDEKIKTIEKHLSSMKEVKNFFTTIGASNDKSKATINVKLVPVSERKKSQSDLVVEVRDFGQKIEGVQVNVNETQMGSQSGGASNPIQINIKATESTHLGEVAKKVEDSLKSIPGIIDVNNSAKSKKTEINVKVDPLTSAEYGLSTSDISGIIRSALQGSSAGVFRTNGNDYDITVKYEDDQLKTMEDISAIKITNNSGNLIEVGQVSTVTRTDTQQSISRMDRQDVAKITANIQNVVLGDINKIIVKKIDEIELPRGYEIEFGGTQKQMTDSFTSLIQALIASIFLVYLILVVLYESFFTPALRLISIPCAAIGALLFPFLTNKPLDMVTMIGIIMLDGLASKNGTLLIDYTNTLMKRGLSLREALIKSGTTRLRPIIMTSVTMVVGMLPAALALGEGSELKSSMALVIIGGMISSTIFTPILIPVIYTLFDDVKNFFTRNKTKKNGNSEILEV